MGCRCTQPTLEPYGKLGLGLLSLSELAPEWCTLRQLLPQLGRIESIGMARRLVLELGRCSLHLWFAFQSDR